jgi:hypothetical protein
MANDRGWTEEDARRAFMSKEAPEALEIISAEVVPSIEELIAWAMANDLRTSTGCLYFLASVAESRGLFERMAANMNHAAGCVNPWAPRP